MLSRFQTLACLALAVFPLEAQELARVDVYAVTELSFTGSAAQDTDFWVRIRHESGAPEYRIHGFRDGGTSFRVRFCPTQAGRWNVAEVHSDDSRLNGQKQGGHILAQASGRRGFWLADPDSPGGRWYRRSDGSHQYIFGNTQYGFLSQTGIDGKPTGSNVARDMKANARYFKKVRFSVIGDRYPDGSIGPFLDDAGRPTYDGAWSHRPNPVWFRERVDVAVQTAFDEDLIADLILAGPDLPTSRVSLAPVHNGGDPGPYLRYIAARYGAYPNVWICLANEFDIKEPRYTADRIKEIGAMLRKLLPYPTPVSVHRNAGPWLSELNTPAWNDHVIIQRKLKTLGQAADAIAAAYAAGAGKPVIDDELSYQGAGDGHLEADTLASHLGAFLGGGYATTGYKASGPREGIQALKSGQYFTGNFNPEEHSAARGLRWLREIIDSRITFWKMAPDTSIFRDPAAGIRGMAWPGHEYVVGTDKAAKVRAVLPPGQWDIRSYDVIAQKEVRVLHRAQGEITFEAPASRAVLFHLVKSAGE